MTTMNGERWAYRTDDPKPSPYLHLEAKPYADDAVVGVVATRDRRGRRIRGGPEGDVGRPAVPDDAVTGPVATRDRRARLFRRGPEGDVGTPAVIVAAAVLVGLAVAAHSVNDAGSDAATRRPAGTADLTPIGTTPNGTTPNGYTPGPAASPGKASPTPSPSGPSSGTETVGSGGRRSWRMVVVPDSDCRRFVDTTDRFPTITISVQNSCQ
ncbi:MAG TPA: hypothetical protein VI248_04240 [Kineosporiaceae bacterium]